MRVVDGHFKKHLLYGIGLGSVFLGTLALIGCPPPPGDFGDADDDDSDDPSTIVYDCDGEGTQPPEADYSISGVVTYDYVPQGDLGSGLDYASTERRPIRHARVVLISSWDCSEIAETTSDESGAYRFDYTGPANVRLWVYAETTDPPIRVEDNTADDAVYVYQSDAVNAAETSTLNANAGSGWGGGSYTSPRNAAPFSILDAAYEAAEKFLDETSSPPDFPLCILNWSVKNRASNSFDVSTGEIVTSHWDGSEMYILGDADSDTDEYDTDVIVHEWGHYFESTLGRSDSIGGSHSSGYILDPRVAFGEGWGNALSAIVHDPDTVYSDSYGPSQATSFGFDLETNNRSLADAPGWYSEDSINAILFDLYDDADETMDDVALGLDPIYQVMIGAQKNTPALTTIFSFISALKEAEPDAADAIDALVTWHTYDGDYGFDVITDEWGSGESHDAGAGSNVPVYHKVDIGDSVDITFAGGQDYNWWHSNRYLYFEGNGSKVDISSSASVDVDIYVQHEGEYLAAAESAGGNEHVSVLTKEGEIYVVNVLGWTNQTNYTATIDIE